MSKSTSNLEKSKGATEPTSKAIIEQIEKIRGSRVISYVVSTRRGLSFQIADDAVRVIYDHLDSIGKGQRVEKVDLFIHSFGGAGTVPWKLVNLIREHSNHFEVLVPYKAYSAATLIAIGADKIIMHPMGELGPIDPQVGNDFNPITPHGQPIGINVEDVVSYINFVKDLVGITHQDELVQALNSLTDKVHPLALGNVYRFYSQSRMMARKLLGLHMDMDQKHVIDEITETLTSKLFFHGHPINRAEARDLKLKVEDPDSKLENLMWSLYLSYEKDLEMNTTFDPRFILNSDGSTDKTIKVKGACVESKDRKDVFENVFRIVRPPIPTNAPLELQIQSQNSAISIPISEGWSQII